MLGAVKKYFRSWQDSNLQSPDPKSGALSIRPHDLSYEEEKKLVDTITRISVPIAISCVAVFVNAVFLRKMATTHLDYSLSCENHVFTQPHKWVLGEENITKHYFSNNDNA